MPVDQTCTLTILRGTMLGSGQRAILLLVYLSIIFINGAVNLAHAQQRFTIAIVDDFSAEQGGDVRARHIRELDALAGNEFDLNYLDYRIDWYKDNYQQQFTSIYRNPKVDMVLVLGVAANQIAIKRKNFPKPTFLPFVVERDLANAPFKKVEGRRRGVSNKKNLSYLTYSTQFLESIDALREVVNFNKMVVLGDEALFKVLPPEVVAANPQAGQPLLDLVQHDGVNHDLLSRISSSADAVMLGYLPRLPRPQLYLLIEQLTQRKIPTFSYLEEGLVEQGLLATPLNESVYLSTARRNALNMQAVMLGEPASQQPVLLETKAKLTINESTAQRLGIAINFKVLVDADVINFGKADEDDRLGLLQITERALQNNLNLRNTKFDLDIQQNERAIAKGGLLPQLSANASYSQRREDSSLVQSGFAAEDSTDASLEISQTIYSDSQWANVKIQNLLSQASSEEYRQAQLDTVREASLAMADVLQAESVAAIQQENLAFSEKNLELAVDRVSIGVSSSADQYRWETQVSNAKSAVFDSFSNVLIAKQNLNRVLNREITAPLEVMPLDMDSTMVYSSKEIFELMDNTATFEKVYYFGLDKAFETTPEIRRLDAIINAKKRELKTLGRRAWVPDVSLSGQLSENIDSSSVATNDRDGRDWQIMLNARIPFYQGGQIKAKKKRGDLELAQLENQLATVKQRLAQNLRASMNNVITSLFNLDFSRDAAIAASKSLSLVTDAYTKGAVPVVDLLDAQTSSINANLAEVQASISFFRANIEMQRTIGLFEFLMSDEQKQDIRRQIGAAAAAPRNLNENRNEN